MDRYEWVVCSQRLLPDPEEIREFIVSKCCLKHNLVPKRKINVIEEYGFPGCNAV
jgi:hypothetical protein